MCIRDRCGRNWALCIPKNGTSNDMKGRYVEVVNYLVRRVVQIIPLLILISLVNFFIMHLAPGNPVLLMTDRNAPPEEVARIEALYGLDQPIYIQYFKWICLLYTSKM